MTADPAKLDRSARTVYENLIRAMLVPIKSQRKVWSAMSQADQDTLLAQFDNELRQAIRDAVDLVAADGMPHIKVTLKKVTFADGVQGTIEMANTDTLRHRLADAANKIVILVVPDYEAHLKGERPQPEPVQRDLGLASAVETGMESAAHEAKAENDANAQRQAEELELQEKAARKNCFIALIDAGEEFDEEELALWSMEQVTEARAWAETALLADDPATIPDMPAFMRRPEEQSDGR